MLSMKFLNMTTTTRRNFDYELNSSKQGLATNESQEEYFQGPIQQYNTPDTKPNIDNNASTSSSNLGVSKEDDNPVSGVLDDNNDDNNDDKNSTSNSGVGENNNNTSNLGVGTA